MRAMHPKSPAERRWGMHRASILPPRGVFAVRSPQIMHGARILPPSGGPAPVQGLLPEQLHRGIVLQRLGPCSGMPTPAPRQYPPPANACHLPMPAACRARCSQRQAADELRRRSSGAWPAVRPSPEGPPTTSSRRAGRQRSAAQNRRRRPQAGPGLRQRCQKRPSKGRVPLGGTIGTPPHASSYVRRLNEIIPIRPIQ